MCNSSLDIHTHSSRRKAAVATAPSISQEDNSLLSVMGIPNSELLRYRGWVGRSRSAAKFLDCFAGEKL